jgi:hypothetical protein
VFIAFYWGYVGAVMGSSGVLLGFVWAALNLVFSRIGFIIVFGQAVRIVHHKCLLGFAKDSRRLWIGGRKSDDEVCVTSLIRFLQMIR